MVKEAFDVSLDDPLRSIQRNDFRQSLQRLMRVPLWAKSIRALPKLRLPDRLQDTTQPILHDPVLEARDAQGPPLAVRLRDVHPSRRLGHIPHPSQPGGQISQLAFQPLLVGRLRDPINSRGFARVLPIKTLGQTPR